MFYRSNFNYIVSTFILLFLLMYFIYKILFGENNIFYVYKFEQLILQDRVELDILQSRNHMLAQKIKFLKDNPKAYEEQARFALGMIKPGEEYFQVVMPVE